MSDALQSEVVKSVSEAGDYPNGGKHSKYSDDEYEGKKQSRHPSDSPVGRQGRPGSGTRSGSGSRILPSLLNATLPLRIAIIVGLCQVAVGGAMVLIGILAIRYQSYLFHYGTGLWAGLLSSITGMLGVMCTKKGVPKPSWLCGGRKWQVHVFLLSIVFSLSAVTLLAIFSISGLLQDAKTIMAVDETYSESLETLVGSKNTSGILINTLLLLLSILQILLCFSSLGITVRVMYKTSAGGLLSSSKAGSTGSEIVVRDGAEYHARKDHLIHWLGHQRPALIPMGPGGSPPPKIAPLPTFVAIQPVMYPHPRGGRMMIQVPFPQQKTIIMTPQPPPPPSMILSPSNFSFGPQPIPMAMPMILPPGVRPPPSRTSRRTGNGTATPVSSVASLSVVAEHQRMRQQQRRRQHQQNGRNCGGMVMGPGVRSLGKAPSVISGKTERSEKNNELEVTEVDVSRIQDTYTGLDRSIAEEYISAMNLRKISSTDSSTHPVSMMGEDDDEVVRREEEEVEAEDDDSSEPEITRM